LVIQILGESEERLSEVLRSIVIVMQMDFDFAITDGGWSASGKAA
jgi:hypothetical protein